MKYLFLLTFCCLGASCFAQNNSGIDSTLQFNQRFTKCEKKWVVLSKKGDSGKYAFGYIYIDQAAGFTYDAGGLFAVDKDNKYVVDTITFKDTHFKVRLMPNWQLVAPLSPAHFDELGIKAEPSWIKSYYNYTDTVAHNYRWGWIYNDLGECKIALTYLQQAYNMNQHAEGVEFEMAFAYNALAQYDDAIKVLGPAIQNKPDDAYFYKELAFAYSHKKDFENAISTYKKGLVYFPDKPSESKGEMAFNMAFIYKEMGNQDEYKNWMIKAKAYTPQDSAYYKRITDAGF